MTEKVVKDLICVLFQLYLQHLDLLQEEIGFGDIEKGKVGSKRASETLRIRKGKRRKGAGKRTLRSITIFLFCASSFLSRSFVFRFIWHTCELLGERMGEKWTPWSSQRGCERTKISAHRQLVH